MREDIEVCVASWDAKTDKKVKKSPIIQYALEDLDQFLGEDQAIAVEPAGIHDPDGPTSAWGILALSPHQLLFHSASGQVRFSLDEVDHFHINRPESLADSFFMAGLLDIRAGTAENCFEILTQGSVQRLWPELETQVAQAKTAKADARSHTLGPVSSASVADELSKLAQLRADGILTDEEFSSAKRQLLGA